MVKVVEVEVEVVSGGQWTARERSYTTAYEPGIIMRKDLRSNPPQRTAQMLSEMPFYVTFFGFITALVCRIVSKSSSLSLSLSL